MHALCMVDTTLKQLFDYLFVWIVSVFVFCFCLFNRWPAFLPSIFVDFVYATQPSKFFSRKGDTNTFLWICKCLLLLLFCFHFITSTSMRESAKCEVF